MAGRGAISEETETSEFIAWTVDRFRHLGMVLTTQFGMEGCALIDLYAEAGAELTVVYLDTMFLFPETYALRDRLAARYPKLRFENRGTALTPAAQAAIHGDRLWTTDPDRCCRIRKVDPMAEALRGVDVWITGITRSQSAVRSAAPLIGWDWSFQLVKVNPLVRWDRERTWRYVREHGVPYNPLHEAGYSTIGCVQCTRPVAGVRVDEYTRLGRWAGADKTECGLHGAPRG